MVILLYIEGIYLAQSMISRNDYCVLWNKQIKFLHYRGCFRLNRCFDPRLNRRFDCWFDWLRNCS